MVTKLAFWGLFNAQGFPLELLFEFARDFGGDLPCAGSSRAFVAPAPVQAERAFAAPVLAGIFLFSVGHFAECRA
jgi:hypothetical protein